MSPAEPGRFFCTAGRGLEPFLAREVQARLGATEVDCVAGKVFFRAAAGPGELRKLRSGERLFLLLKKHGPLPVARNRGKMLHEIKSFVTEEPEYWLDIISVWRKLHGHERKTDDVSEEKSSALKRNSEETNTASKRQKTEQVRAIMSEECQAEAGETCVAPERMSGQECCIESKTSSEFPSKGSGENPTANEELSFSFRVSCRCSGAIAKILTSQGHCKDHGARLLSAVAFSLEEGIKARTCSFSCLWLGTGENLFFRNATLGWVLGEVELGPWKRIVAYRPPRFRLIQPFSHLCRWEIFSRLKEIGKAIGIALVKQCGWHADLRDPDLEIFVHLNDIHSVVGIPLFRLPLANREYIQTAGLRSTVAWAMASLAEISAGAFVLDPMCGLGMILLEAAKEWPEAYYWGADISDSQLEGADGNIRTAGLMDKIELLKASVKVLPLPSESFDSVISDIPFGKKFKTTNDAQLLTDILQEMERVLRVGGTLVLLLSQELRRRVDDLTMRAGGDSAEASADGDSGAAPTQAPSVDGNSFSLALSGEEAVLSRYFGSLVPEGVYAVRLGKTDAFIHKYRKVSAAGYWKLSGPGLKRT
ncbi:PREDICTED: THUMP domain-containing protein 2 isoform X1 [Pseudopodoces humilis]|uniref:THUMP domain-containing protein 2 isoform X1 n=1 Tax=Pseudopodoces humilis TaxID=181119 RepID=UPI0006B75FBA|nr:PREDICTED: THUMP domain-containing protein 2 isoform X1 [Pseudopodoces humilis]